MGRTLWLHLIELHKIYRFIVQQWKTIMHFFKMMLCKRKNSFCVRNPSRQNPTPFWRSYFLSYMQSKCYLEIVRLFTHLGTFFYFIFFNSLGNLWIWCFRSKDRKILHLNSSLNVDNEHNKEAQSYSVCNELRQQSLSEADCSQGITESVLDWIRRNA